MKSVKTLLLVVLSVLPNTLGSAQSTASGIDGLSLDKTMKLIQDKMNAQGPLHYAVYRYAANLDPSLVKTSGKVVWQTDISQSGFNADPANCVVGFHEKQATEYSIGTPPPSNRDFDWSIRLKSSSNSIMTPEMVSVTDGAHQSVLRGKMQRMPDTLYRVDPQFFIVEVRVSQAIFFELNVHNQEDANIVSQAMQHAISVCNHLGNEVF